MSLIKCPECGKKVNYNDDICNNCGYPLNEIKTINGKNNKKIYIILCSIVVILIIGCVFLFKILNKNYVACFEKKDICIKKEELQEMAFNTTNTDIEALIYLLDEKLLKDVYSSKCDKVKKEVNDALQQYREQFKSEREYLDALEIGYGYNSVDEAKRDYSLMFYRYEAVQDYENKHKTDAKNKEYYKDETNNDKFPIKVMKEFRKEYGLKIYDKNLKTKYEEYLKKELSSKESE